MHVFLWSFVFSWIRLFISFFWELFMWLMYHSKKYNKLCDIIITGKLHLKQVILHLLLYKIKGLIDPARWNSVIYMLQQQLWLYKRLIVLMENKGHFVLHSLHSWSQLHLRTSTSCDLQESQDPLTTWHKSELPIKFKVPSEINRYLI